MHDRQMGWQTSQLFLRFSGFRQVFSSKFISLFFARSKAGMNTFASCYPLVIIEQQKLCQNWILVHYGGTLPWTFFWTSTPQEMVSNLHREKERKWDISVTTAQNTCVLFQMDVAARLKDKEAQIIQRINKIHNVAEWTLKKMDTMVTVNFILIFFQSLFTMRPIVL